MPFITLSTCSLNQWALDFSGNLTRSLKSFEIAQAQGSTYRLGPELELSGYGCNDHFLEDDTVLHSWETLVQLIKADVTKNIIGDVGMPVQFNGALYNCRIIFLNRRILLIRPKMHLANDGNYREMRWFTPWIRKSALETFILPDFVKEALGQRSTSFGNGVLDFGGIYIGTELCEELFTPSPPHVDLSLQGTHIITNGSASHHEFQKLHTRIDLIRNATAKCGGIYVYANQQGCDGERVYYDGCALVAVNGNVVGQGKQFSVADVEVVTAVVDSADVDSYRAGKVSRALQSAHYQSLKEHQYPVIHVDMNSFVFATEFLPQGKKLSSSIQVKYLSPSQEIEYGPACWLWDYLRRSKSAGFFLPLSGGIDSCATALVVYSMCDMVCNAIRNEKDPQVINDMKKFFPQDEDLDYSDIDAKTLCGAIFSTCYLATENSSTGTKDRAQKLAKGIGSSHLSININTIITSIMSLFSAVTGKSPKYKVYGGTATENLALQNVQARVRMVVSYLFAQLLPWTRGQSGGLLVLGSANVDETLRGYLTKYDCSSADLNPIGGISKTDLRKFIYHMSNKADFAFLEEFLDAPPTAELEPITETYLQKDEVDMGMTYNELSVFGTLRKVAKMGPFGMFKRLASLPLESIGWSQSLNLSEISEKVKRFFFYYSINRHKTTILPPSYHMSAYSPDDNRFDLRPFLYNAGWTWQFEKMDEYVKKCDQNRNE